MNRGSIWCREALYGKTAGATHRAISPTLRHGRVLRASSRKCRANSREFETPFGAASVFGTATELQSWPPLQVAVLSREERKRADEQNDALFYAVPRFVQYVDEKFKLQVRNWYAQHLRDGDAVLDLCSAYDSHLPDVTFGRVVGQGMSAPELKANGALDAYFVKDLNTEPVVLEGEDIYDAVLCCMGLQYLRYPEDVCLEVFRILKPKGKFLISFTSHCFPEKTVMGWLERTLEERAELVKRLLFQIGFVDVECVSCVATPDSPHVISDSVLDAEACPSIDFPECSSSGEAASQSDPFFGVMGVKPGRPTDPYAAIMEMAPFEWDVRNELDLPSGDVQLFRQKSRRALSAYTRLCQWAVSLGIPQSAVRLPDDSETLENLKAKRDYLKGMIASFVSSGL